MLGVNHRQVGDLFDHFDAHKIDIAVGEFENVFENVQPQEIVRGLGNGQMEVEVVIQGQDAFLQGRPHIVQKRSDSLEVLGGAVFGRLVAGCQLDIFAQVIELGQLALVLV